MKPLDCRSRFILASLLALACSSCTVFLQEPPGQPPAPAEILDRRFTTDEVRADYQHLLAVCEEVHPDLYARASREEIAVAIERELAALPVPPTRVEIYPGVARVVAKFQDAHTSASLPVEEWNRFVTGDGLLFPVDVQCRDGALVVTAVHSNPAEIHPGDEIAAVNGTSAQAIVAAYRATHSGTDAFVFSNLGARLRSQLWLLGIQSPFRVECVAARSGARHESTLAGMTSKDLQPRAATATPAANYRFERLDTDIGYLDFRSMTDRKGFAAFLSKTFSELRDRPVRGLIVDLRRNGGGDSSLGEDLLRYLTDKPFRMAARKEWKSSDAYRKRMKQNLVPWIRWLPLQYCSSFGREFWGVPEGSIVVSGQEAETHTPSEPRFRGPVCFLIGRGTFSSAMMLADAVGAYHLATLIGEETGGEPNAFGEIYPFALPNTHLDIWVSSARFVRANGDASDLRGVLPDIEVRASPADIATGRDTVLEAARAWIGSSSRATEPR